MLVKKVDLIGAVLLGLASWRPVQETPQRGFLVLETKGQEVHWHTTEPGACISDVKIGPVVRLEAPFVGGYPDFKHAEFPNILVTYNPRCSTAGVELERK